VAADTVKQRLNVLLTRLTGHHLATGAPGAAQRRLLYQLRAARDERDVAIAKLVAAERALEATQKPAARDKRTNVVFPGDFDKDARKIIRAAMPYTMTDLHKLHALITAVRYVVRYNVPGDIVECGVWRGGSMHAVARALTVVGDQSRDLYLYDTFEGMPDPGEEDLRWDGRQAKRVMDTDEVDSLAWAVAPLEEVQEGFQDVPYPSDRIHYIKGKVEETVPQQLPQQISILRLHTDWYESTAHELAHMYERLAPGGVLMLDDYGHWAGAKKATDEFLERTGEPLLLLRMSNGRVAVKPWR
jgi:O-methyltransferase